MSKVKKHVDKLFAKYPKTDETIELKEEVIGNLEAEIEDLQSGGLSFEEAVRISIRKMASLDELIDGVKSVWMRQVLMEMMQWTLIYTLLAWIVTIPLSVFYSMRSISWVLFCIVIVVGISYLMLSMIRKALSRNYVEVNLYKIAAVRKFMWMIWALFIVVNWGMTTAMLFGSNIWFWRPISINGPYEFANIGIMYIMPLITMIFPLLTSKYYTVVIKQGGDYS